MESNDPTRQPDGSTPSRPTLPVSVPPGERFGKFVRVARLGAGGMGEVWKAWDTALSRWVALKFLIGGDEEEVARFRREAQLAGALSHPNIAAVYEVGDEGRQAYIAMQFVDGATLKAVVRGDRREAARVVRDAAKAVAFAHSHGIIHRDLKPENIMVSGGRVVVMDFGLARAVEGGSEITTSGLVEGTPGFMPPEQAQGRRVEASADVYGLGATLYWLLTRRPPHQAATVFETLKSVIEDEPVPPRRLDPAVEADLEAIVLKCLEKDPAGRYPGADALAEDLDRYLAGESVVAKPAGAAVRIGKTLARWRLVVAIVAMAVMVSAGAWMWTRRRIESTEGSLTGAQKALIEQMRRTTDSLLASALDQRRAGRLSEMRAMAAKIEEECAKVLKELPSLPEAHYRLARIRRAMMRDAAALESAGSAIELDPSYAAARYERVVLSSRRLRERLRELTDLWRAAEAARRLGADGTLDLEALKPDPSSRDLIEGDDEARALKVLIEEDLARIEGLGEAELACVEGLRAWAAGRDVAAVPALERAASREEAIEALGAIAEERGNLEGAEAWWSKGIAEDAGYLPFWEGRGRVRLAKAKKARQRGEPSPDLWQAGMSDYDKMVELDPAMPRGWLRRAAGRLEVAFAATAAGGREAAYEAAADDASKAISLDGSWAEAWWVRGRLRLNWGFALYDTARDGRAQLEGAIADFGEAMARSKGLVLTIAVDRVMVRSVLSHARGLRGEDAVADFEQAIREATDAVNRNLRHEPSWTSRAFARTLFAHYLKNRGRDASKVIAEGIQDAESSVVLNPRSEWGWRVLGLLRRQVAEAAATDAAYAVAEEAFTRAIEVDRSSPELWKERAGVRLERAQRRMAEGGDGEPGLRAALEDTRKAQEVGPRLGGAWDTAGQIEVALGEVALAKGGDPLGCFERAASAFSKSIELHPGRASAWSERATVRLRMAGLLRGDDRRRMRQGAIDDARQAVKLSPGMPALWSRLGTILGSTGVDLAREEQVLLLIEEALAAHARAIEGGYGAPALAARADTYFCKGSAELALGRDAVPSFERAITEGEASLKVRESSEAWKTMGQAKYVLALLAKDRDASLAERHFAGAIEALERAHALGRNKTNLLGQLGMVRGARLRFAEERGEAEDAGQRAQAVREMRSGLASSPLDGPLRIELAHALTREGAHRQDRGEDPTKAYEEAVVHCDAALVLDAGNDDAHLRRGVVRRNLAFWHAATGRFSRKEYEAAIEDLDAALKRHPDRLEALRARAETRVLMAQNALTTRGWPAEALKAAIADFDRAIRLVPDDAEVLAARGRAWGKLGVHYTATSAPADEAYEAALEDLDLALKRKPAMSVAWHDRGAALYSWGAGMEGDEGAARLKQADESLAKAASLDPKFFLTRLYLGLTRLALAQRGVLDRKAGAEAAIQEFDECVRLNPGMKASADRYRAQARALLDK